MHGLYTTKVAKKVNDGKVKINMTKRAKAFWEGPVWNEWAVKFPNLKGWLKKYPRDDVVVVVVPAEFEE